MAGDEHGAVHFVVECDLAITAPSRHDLDEMNFQAASTLTLTGLAPLVSGGAMVGEGLGLAAKFARGDLGRVHLATAASRRLRPGRAGIAQAVTWVAATAGPKPSPRKPL
jgi:hypothetical protein